jgi:hypothetical protein
MSCKVSFLIINYNGGPLILNCIRSILTFASDINKEIIVVDNHSKDNSIAEVEKQFPEVVIQKNRENVGFASGMNQAYRLSHGEYLFSFNPDAQLTAGCMRQLITYMDQNPSVGKAGTASVEEDTLTLPVTEFVHWHQWQIMKILKARFKFHAQGAPSGNTPILWLFGTGILIRRAALPGDYIYPEYSFLFWEEYWLSKSIREKGFSIQVLPDARIIHHGGMTYKTQVDKLKVARLLSYAHEYKIRKVEYSTFNAWFNAIQVFCDHAFLYAFFAPKLLWRQGDIDLYNTAMDYYAKARAALLILLKNNKSISAIDRDAKAFFNK